MAATEKLSCCYVYLVVVAIVVIFYKIMISTTASTMHLSTCYSIDIVVVLIKKLK